MLSFIAGPAITEAVSDQRCFICKPSFLGLTYKALMNHVQ